MRGKPDSYLSALCSAGAGDCGNSGADRCRLESGMEITALVGTWSGPNEWNFRQGPQTLGIVPAAYRYARMQELVRCAELARMLEVPGVCTHMGFIPENPNDPAYGEFVGAAR